MPTAIENQTRTDLILNFLTSKGRMLLVTAAAVGIIFLSGTGMGNVFAEPAVDEAAVVTTSETNGAIFLEGCCDVFVRENIASAAILYDFGRSVNDEAEWALYAPKTATVTGELYDFGRSVNDEADWAQYSLPATETLYDFGRSVNDEADWARYSLPATETLYDFGRSVNDEADWALYALKAGTTTGELYDFGRSVNDEAEWALYAPNHPNVEGDMYDFGHGFNNEIDFPVLSQ